MCGIAGLHLKDPERFAELGSLLTPMLDCLTDRGPDSAGVALYTDSLPPGRLRYSVRSDDPQRDWSQLATALSGELGADTEAVTRGTNAVVTSDAAPDHVRAALSSLAPDVRLLGYGRAIEVAKDVGPAGALCRRQEVIGRAGYQGIGHTRMATESAVTIDHSHPFAPAADLALVHNGSFSNYPTVRRRLTRDGEVFDTDNDSEVAARFVARQLEAGCDLGEALRHVRGTLDGFFTLLVATRTEFAVLRDSFACKPAVVAETPGYVAVASEYRALAHLPDIADAAVFEPQPNEIHLWAHDPQASLAGAR